MLSDRAQDLVNELNKKPILMGQIKKMAKGIKKDHTLALELWSTKAYYPRLLAILILDNKELTQTFIEELVKDLRAQEIKERNQVVDWLLSNQLKKSVETKALIETWIHHPEALLRRTFWLYQVMLRWMGNVSHTNTPELIDVIKSDLGTEDPIVQWSMNMCAAWIGIYDISYRDDLLAYGEQLGLYKEEKRVPGCTPNYLPDFIRIESEKKGTVNI